MQSSPPTRAHQRPPSPTESQYSIDLAALDGKSRSGASSPALPEQHVDRILSEEIDGPSDFTQNLEAWMRGGTMSRKGTTNGKLSTLRDTQEGVQGRRQMEGSEQHLAPEDEDNTESRHTPTASPPKESVFGGSRYDRSAQEGSSDWNPYAESATPQPPPHQQFLQPTVEDYYSELTPARPASTRTSRSASQHYTANVAAQDVVDNYSEPSSPGRPSSETISPVRSPVIQRSMPRNFSSQTDEASFERQLQELSEKCQRLEHLNTALSQAIDEERRMRQQDHEMYEAKLAAAARREGHLIEMKEQANAYKEDFRVEFNEMKENSSRQDRHMIQLKQNHSSELHQEKQHAERDRSEHVQEIRALEQDVELARRSRDDAEEMARTAKDDLEEYKAARNAATTKDETLRSSMSELQEQIQALTSEHETLKVAKKRADETSTALRSELSLLRQTQEEDTTRLAADHRRAVTVAESLQSQLRDLRQQMHERTLAHDVEVIRLRTTPQGLAPPPPAESIKSDDSMIHTIREQLTQSQTELNKAHCQLDQQQTALNIAVVERDAAQDEVSAIRSQLEEAKSQPLESNHTNRQHDDNDVDLWKKRAEIYSKKLEAMKEDQKLMEKALMIMWGREECGPAPPGEAQPYRYKYVNKDGTDKVLRETVASNARKTGDGNGVPVMIESDAMPFQQNGTNTREATVGAKDDQSTTRKDRVAALGTRQMGANTSKEAATRELIAKVRADTEARVAMSGQGKAVSRRSLLTQAAPIKPVLTKPSPSKTMPTRSFSTNGESTEPEPTRVGNRSASAKHVPLRTALAKIRSEREASGRGVSFDLHAA